MIRALIAAIAVLIAAPASAGFKISNPPDATPDWTAQCRQTFASISGLTNCMRTRIPANVTHLRTGSTSWRVIDSTCRAWTLSDGFRMVGASWTGSSCTATGGGNFSCASTFSPSPVNVETGSGLQLRHDIWNTGCSNPQATTAQNTNPWVYNVVTVADPGSDTLPEERTCQSIPCSYAPYVSSQSVTCAAGQTTFPSVAGMTFVYGAPGAARPVKNEGGIAPVPDVYPPGALGDIVDTPTQLCTIGRRSRYSARVNGQAYFFYESVLRSPVDSPAETVDTPIVVTASRVSNPVIPHGTPVDAAGKAGTVVTLANSATLGVDALCIDSACTFVSDNLKIRLERQNDGTTLAYAHPDATKLARDNPDAKQKFDPRVAWSPSNSPATSTTRPQDLIRLAADGQRIVANDPDIHRDTVYPQAMRTAGTAPTAATPLQPDQPTGTPEQPGTEDGDTSWIGKLLGESGGVAGLNGEKTSDDIDPQNPGDGLTVNAIGTGEGSRAASLGSPVCPLIVGRDEHCAPLTQWRHTVRVTLAAMGNLFLFWFFFWRRAEG